MVKTKLFPRSGSTALKQLNPIRKKGSIKFFFDPLPVCLFFSLKSFLVSYKNSSNMKGVANLYTAYAD